MNNSVKSFKRQYLKENKYHITLLVLLALAHTTSMLVFPYYSKMLIDFMTKSAANYSFDELLIFGIAYIIVYYVLKFFYVHQKKKITVDITNSYKVDILKKIDKLSLGKYRQKENGYYLSLLENDLNFIPSYNDLIITYLQQGLMLLFIIGILVYLNVWITLCVLVVVGFYFVFITTYQKKLKKIDIDRLQYYTSVKNAEQELVNSKLTIRVNNCIDYLIKSYYYDKIVNLRKFTLMYNFNSIYAYQAFDLLQFVLQTGMFLTSGYLISNGYPLTIGDVVAFSGYMGFLLSPINALGQAKIARQSIDNYVERILYLFDENEQSDYNQVKLKFQDDIELKNISCTLGERVIFTDLNLTLYFNRFNIVFGESGKGKSTLARILLGLEYFDGEIFIDKKCYKNDSYCYQNTKNKVGYCMPQPQLFNMSVARNITLSEDYDKNKLYDLMQKLDIIDLQNVVAEKNSNLSDGQKKRIEIARTLFNTHDLYLFDEPTANLDYENSKKVIDCIKEYCHNKTVVIFTHDQRFNEKDWINHNL